MKKWMKRFCSVLLCLGLVLGLLPAAEIQAAGKVKLNYTTLTISQGDTRTLIVSGTSRKMTWSSSNKKVATISSKGVVTGVKKGKAIITAKYGTKKLTCKITVLGLDPEVQRGITLGLVSKDYLKNPSAMSTTKEAEDILAKILKKKGASSSKIKKWNKLAQGSKENITLGDVAMGIYYAASLLATDGIPQTNTETPGDYWPKDWDDSTYRLIPSVNDPEHPTKYYNYDGFHGEDPLVENSDNQVAAVGYALQLASHYSGQMVLLMDYDKDAYYINRKLTRAQLVLSLVRFYDSFEEEAHYISIAALDDQCPISQTEIKSAKKVPEVDENGQSSEWIGTYIQNYGCVGKNGSWTVGAGDNTWNFREGDFMAMADLGVNYVRIQFTINSFAYPDFSTDRSKLNQALVEELDDVVRWGLKYGLHVSICFAGYLDDDLDGLGAMYPDGTKENDFTPDQLASKESYALKGKLLAGFAGRYKNVPAKNLSFELQNENGMEMVQVDGVQMLTNDEMAEQFIMLAQSVWNVTPERGVSLSTCAVLNEEYREYWSKLAGAGISIDYHCYEPRSYIAPNYWENVDASKMKWPGYKDENGVTWDMEKVYQTYVAPWKELADEYHVGFKLGECGIFADTELFTDTPYTQKDVVAWAEDFATVMQKHQVSYAIGKFVGESSIVTTFIRDISSVSKEATIYIKNAKYTKKTYRLKNYTLTVYVNAELVKAAFGKKK